MKFLCDSMLIRIGRWLRCAGYDTVIASGEETDRELVEQSRREARTLLTRDHKIMEIRHAGEVAMLLQCNAVEACIHEISQRLAVDWQYSPFTRCMVCNSLLESASEAQMAHIPQRSRAVVHSASHCPGCGRVYWEGGHVVRMRAKLAAWARA